MRTRDALFAKLVSGFGVLGGMRLGRGAATGVSFSTLCCTVDPPPGLDALLPNPQAVAGTVIEVSAGVAVDSRGRTLALCAPVGLDIAALSAGLPGGQETRTFCAWFGQRFCDSLDGAISGNMTAAEFWVVAEQVDTAARPMPRFVGGESCDGAPTCDFSRQLEDVRIRLVKDLPAFHFMHGCLEPKNIPGIDILFGALAAGTLSAPGPIGTLTGETSPIDSPDGASHALIEEFDCSGFRVFPQVTEFLNALAVDNCCATPAVALGRVLLATEVPTQISDALGPSSLYVIVDDGFPYRRIVPNAAMNQTLALLIQGQATCPTT
jgi:hypothetical protein